MKYAHFGLICTKTRLAVGLHPYLLGSSQSQRFPKMLNFRARGRSDREIRGRDERKGYKEGGRGGRASSYREEKKRRWIYGVPVDLKYAHPTSYVLTTLRRVEKNALIIHSQYIHAERFTTLVLTEVLLRTSRFRRMVTAGSVGSNTRKQIFK